MMAAGPMPNVGSPGNVILNGQALTAIPGTYKVTEAQRFGQKLSIGVLKYGDFTPYDSAESVGPLAGGFGLRRYSDNPDATTAATMFHEADGVDTRGTPITLADLQTAETLPAAAVTPVWSGEFTPNTGVGTRYVAVAGTRVYYRNSNGTWTDSGITLPAAARKGAIGVSNGQLIIGFGALATAVYTINLTSTVALAMDDASGSLYVWAITADRAAAYVAGGLTTTSYAKVYSSVPSAATIDHTSGINCGSSDIPITGLAPGGGVAIVFVGKETELAEIDEAGVYRILVPFDSRLSSNCNPLRWAMGAGGAEQRGAVSLRFAREHSLWAYQPDSQTAGSAANISPWADPSLRPQHVRGIITAVQGSARWFYFVVQNGAGQSWVCCQDNNSGKHHILLDLGTNDCQTLGITSLFGTNPLLIVGKGLGVISVILTLDGDAPVDDPARRYCATGTLDLSEMDLGFPDEPKITFVVRVIADNLAAEARSIAVYTSADGGAYALLGTADTMTTTTFNFSPATAVNRLAVRLVFTTDDSSESPQLLGLTVRLSLNTQLYRLWEFDSLIPMGTMGTLADDLSNPLTTIKTMWETRKAGIPVAFVDRWGSPWNVRLFQFGEVDVFSEETRSPETRLSFVLLEVSEGAEASVVWSSAAASGLFLPITFS